MIPTWMIEELEKQQRERELERERPQIPIDLPVYWDHERPAAPTRSSPLVIELVGEALDA